MPVSEPEGAGRAHGLHVEKVGAHVVLRRPGDDDENERRSFASATSSPGGTAVFATATALRDPDFLSALREACRVALNAGPAQNQSAQGPRPTQGTDSPRDAGTTPGRGSRHRIWIAVSGLTRHGTDGVPVAQRLVDEIPVEVLVPDGPLSFVPGGTLFSGSPGGWVRFSPGAREPAFARRYPIPPWEGALPKEPTDAPGVVLEHVSAGLLARPEASEHAGAGPAVPQAPHPRVLVECGDTASPVDPAALSSAIARLHHAVRGQLEFVPVTPRALLLGHGHQLARSLGQDIVLATGFVLRDGNGAERTTVRDETSGASWNPFPRALRCSADGSTRVVAVNPPPRGWVPANALSYRPARDPGDVVARVIPAGLALSPGIPTAPTTADRFAFEPHQMSVVIGDPSVPVPPGVPQALRSLVAGLEPEQRNRCRLIVLGVVDERMRSELTSAAGALAARLRFLEPATEPPAAEPNPRDSAARSVPAAPRPPAPSAPRSETPATLPPLPAARPATVSEPPTALRAQAPTVMLRKPTPNGPEQKPSESRSDETGSAPAENGVVRAELDASAIDPTHRSTAQERARFAANAGQEFDEQLPSVDSALANFPALREAADENAKSDFVAVCFYFDRNGHGANTTNRLLREGGAEPFSDQVACLVSGLRRLPVHRGPAFRMARCEPGESPSYEVGEVLAEPGFLSASSESDLSSEQDHLDVLIWSYNARRTSAFARDGLSGEVVFPASSRFKVLETADEEDEESVPAVLMRELRPGEDFATGTLDEADESVLPRLRRALDRRRASATRMLDDPDHLMRLFDPVGVVQARKHREAKQELAATASAQ